MKVTAVLARLMCAVALVLPGVPGFAADSPAPKEGSAIIRDFRFHTGEVLPEMRLHYTTLGAASGEPVRGELVIL